MALTLYTYEVDFRSFKARIAAEYNGVRIALPSFEMGKDNLTPEFKAKSPLGKVPVLETPEGCLFESNSIARYVAGLRRDTELFGRSFFESGQVDMWCDFCTHEVELPAVMWLYPVFGLFDYHEEDETRGETKLHAAMAVMEEHLTSRTYFVGDKITLADIALASALTFPMRFVLDEAARAKYPCLMRWFLTCVNQPEFYNILGPVILCTERQFAKGAKAKGGKGGKGKGGKGGKGEGKGKGGKGGKKEGGKKEGKKEGKKGGAAGGGGGSGGAASGGGAAAPAKKKGPFDGLPRSEFMSMDGWKRTYSNAPLKDDGERDFESAVREFFTAEEGKGFDPKCYSVWKGSYNYNSDNKVAFMVSNLIGGFVQRSDAIRKEAFGVHVSLGDAAPFQVSGIWMWKGQEPTPMLEANPDAEYYTWTKLDPTKQEDLDEIVAYWTCMDDLGPTKIPVQDSQLFK